MADQVATNGVVHVISKVMYPLPLKDNVVEVVHNTSSLSTLYKAIMATGVSDIIAGLSLRQFFAIKLPHHVKAYYDSFYDTTS